MSAAPARADDRPPPTSVIFAGFEPLTAPYGGIGYETALGGHLWQSGWRGRYVGGIGFDRYDVTFGTIIGGTITETPFRVRKFTADDELLLGYQWILGDVALRVLAGGHARLDLYQLPDGALRRYRYGVTVSSDLHARLGAGWTAELASRITWVGHGWYGRAALFKALNKTLALGAEVAAQREDDSRKLRIAVALRAKLGERYTLGLSAGPIWSTDRATGLYLGFLLIRTN